MLCDDTLPFVYEWVWSKVRPNDTVFSLFLENNSRSAHQPEAHRPQYKYILRLVTTACFPRNCGLKNTHSEVAVSGLAQQNYLQFFFQSLPIL